MVQQQVLLPLVMRWPYRLAVPDIPLEVGVGHSAGEVFALVDSAVLASVLPFLLRPWLLVLRPAVLLPSCLPP